MENSTDGTEQWFLIFVDVHFTIKLYNKKNYNFKLPTNNHIYHEG